MKIYLFYIKSENNTLYAFTDNKEYAISFSEQRNMKLFKFKTMSVDRNYFVSFKNKFWDNYMIPIELEDDDRSYIITGTNNEEIILNDSVEKLGDDMVYLRSYFSSFEGLNKKVLKLIDSLTDISIKNYKIYGEGSNKYDLEMQINTFSLFYYLFRNTFIKDGKD